MLLLLNVVDIKCCWEIDQYIFDYFGKCSSNDDQVCCEDSPTKGLYTIYNLWPSHDLDLHSRWQLPLKLDKLLNRTRTYFNSNISDNTLSYGIQTWHDVDLCKPYYSLLMQVILTLMNRHSGLAEKTKLSAELSKHAPLNSVSHNWPWLWKQLDGLNSLVCFVR